MTWRDPNRVAWSLREHGEVCIQWDTFGRCWSTWQPTRLGVDALFLELGPRAYNSPNWGRR